MPTAAVDPRQRAPVQTVLPGAIYYDGRLATWTPTGALASSTNGMLDPTIVTTMTTNDPSTGVVATGAQAGAPGVWLPKGCLVPVNLAGSPALTGQAAWGTNQYCTYRNNTTYGQWNGSAWVAYTLPGPPAAPTAPTGATAGSPGSWTPAGAYAPYTKASAPAPSPATAWATTGQYVQLNGGEQTYWNGTAWVTGKVP